MRPKIIHYTKIDTKRITRLIKLNLSLCVTTIIAVIEKRCILRDESIFLTFVILVLWTLDYYKSHFNFILLSWFRQSLTFKLCILSSWTLAILNLYHTFFFIFFFNIKCSKLLGNEYYLSFDVNLRNFWIFLSVTFAIRQMIII